MLEFINGASSITKAMTSLDDEFDANFHFELVEIMLKKIKTLENCQILITTHNIDLMCNKLHMRPDCYYLMVTNKITLVAVALKELIQGHNLEKLFKAVSLTKLFVIK